jgi:hypothetical protein
MLSDWIEPLILTLSAVRIPFLSIDKCLPIDSPFVPKKNPSVISVNVL